MERTGPTSRGYGVAFTPVHGQIDRTGVAGQGGDVKLCESFDASHDGDGVTGVFKPFDELVDRDVELGW